MFSTDITLDETTAVDLAQLFQAFSDPSRLRIISALTDCEMNVGALAEEVGLSESATSHQLRGLRQMRLVRARKEGRQVFYCLDDEHVKAIYQLGLEHVLHG
ncbi:MAG: winged helix-turn-helix transcriptional regulator [Anaerolineales bacterium]|nr:winged helix-turn-helix transcriptional regulator [Anaerolineales bacterium]